MLILTMGTQERRLPSQEPCRSGACHRRWPHRSDSNAILACLARKYAPAYIPSDPIGEAEAQKFLTLAAGEVAFGPAAARLITVFNAPLDKNFTYATAAKVLGKLDAHLEGRDWLVGDAPTIADVAIYSYTAHAPEADVSLEPYPNVRRLLSNIEALDGFVAMQSTPVGLNDDKAA